MQSPPLSPVAKSAHCPVFKLILNDPKCRSLRLGLRATHSCPSRRPSGNQRSTISGKHLSAARPTTSYLTDDPTDFMTASHVLAAAPDEAGWFHSPRHPQADRRHGRRSSGKEALP